MRAKLLKSAPLLCFVAMLFYAVEISVADLSLSNLNPRFNTLCYSGGVFILSAIAVLWDRRGIKSPSKRQWVFIGLMVVASLIASNAQFSALHAKSGAVKLSLFYSLLPVTTALLSAIFERKQPTLRMVLAWLLGAAALCLISVSGNQGVMDLQLGAELLSNGIFLCLMAMLFYGVEISIADMELSDLNPRFNTLCYSGGVFVLSIISVLAFPQNITLPVGDQWGFIAMLVVASFIAGCAHFAALHEHSGAVRLSLYYCLLPVVTVLLSAIFEHKMPTVLIGIAWVLAGLALYLVSSEEIPEEEKKGESKQ